jgi:hypothetical protein
MNELSPIMAKHGVFPITRVIQDAGQIEAITSKSGTAGYHFTRLYAIRLYTTDGSFIDLGYRYYPTGTIDTVRPDTMVWGDLHNANKDLNDYNTSLAMINDLKPKALVLHDIFDGHSITHHDVNKSLVRAGKANTNNGLSLYQELYQLGETLQEIKSNGPKGMKMVIDKSNHCESLSKYLEECRYTGDPQNLELSVKLAHAMLQGKDPVQEGIRLTYGSLPQGVRFLQRDDEFNRYGWEMGFHGDKGPNGSRGIMPSFEYSLSKAIIGHTHSSSIRKNIYRVGTLLRKDIDYAKGSPGSWTTTHALVYPNRTAQLVNIYNGKYTA